MAVSKNLEELRKKKNKVVGEGMGVSEEEMQARLDRAAAGREAYRNRQAQIQAEEQWQENPYAQLLASGQADQMSNTEKWETVNSYLEDNPGVHDIWNVQNNRMLSDAVKNQYAADKLAAMTPTQRQTYQGMQALEDDYGALFGIGQRAKNLAAGTAQSFAGSLQALGDVAAAAVGDNRNKVKDPEYQSAIQKLNELRANGKDMTVDGTGKLVETEEYKKALQTLEVIEKNHSTVLDATNSKSVQAVQEGSEKLSKAGLGLDGVPKVAMDTATTVASVLPQYVPAAAGTALGFALGGPAGAAAGAKVGGGVGLGLMSASAAGNRAAELSLQGDDAGRALARGLVSGGIEAATEKLPVDSWVDILTGEGKSVVTNILRQALGEGTEEGVSYLANYVADLAAQDPNAEFSLQELLNNMGQGAAAGGILSAGGTMVNRALYGSQRGQQNQQETVKQQEPRKTEPLQEEAQEAMRQQAANQMIQDQRASGQQTVNQQASVQEVQAQQAEAQQAALEEGAKNGDIRAAAELASMKAERPQQGTAQTLDVQTVEDAGRNVVEGFARRMNLPEAASRGITESYNGSNPQVYVQAWMNAYDAGRTGSLTEEQALAGAGSAAAIVNAPEAMRSAYEIGRKEAGTVAAASMGIAERGGNVKVQGGSSIPVEVLQGVASRYGIDIDVVQQLAADDGTEANGVWEAGLARMTLGENSGNTYQTLQHELTHYIADVNPEGWKRFKNSILSYSSQGGRMGALQSRVVSRYENAYGRGAVAADEAARDILAGVMSTEENVKAFCEHVAADTTSTVAEKRTILQTLRDVLDKVIETLQELVRRSDATSGSRYGRELAEKEGCRSLVEQYLQLLDETERTRRGESMAENSTQKNTPAAASAEVQDKYSRPVRDDEQIRQELQKAQEEERKIREERRSWEDSQEVQDLKARRAIMRAQMGLFGIKKWDEATPEWKAYVEKRKAYNEKIRISREKVDGLAEELKVLANQGKAQREKDARVAYDAEMHRSGLSREEFRRKKANTEYGTTTNFAEAGYIMPDGKMLNFKGEGGTPGQRGMDHRQIADVFAPGELGEDNRTAYMNRFIADGNVRVMAENPGVDVSAESAPSAAQLEQIRKMADDLGAVQHKFGLDISDANGRQVATRWYEGHVSGDQVVQDLRAFYRNGKLPKQDELNAFRYSRGDEDIAERDLEKENRELARRNMRLSEQVETLKEEFKLSGGHRMDKTAVSKLARRVVQEYESRYDVKQLEGELHRYFEYIANSPDVSYEEALDTAQTIMRGVLEQSQRANTDLKDAYQPVKDSLKKMTFLVQKGSPAYHELMNAYGDTEGGPKWGTVRRNTRRLNIKLTDGPGNWDTQFAELAQEYPNLFDDAAGIEQNINSALRVFEADTVYENPYGMDLDTAAQNAAQELFEAYMVTPERYTYADKQAMRVQQLRTEYRQRRQDALQKQKESFDRRLRYERGKADDRLARQKAMFDERMTRRNEGMKWRQERDSIEKIQKRLYRTISQPTDTNHVPEGLRRPVLNLLNSVNWNTRKEGSQAAYQFELAMKNIGDMAAAEIGADGSGPEIDFDPDLKEMIEAFLATAPRDSQGRVDLDPKQTSATQMRRLREILQTVSHSIANANRMMADEKGRQIEEVAVASVHEMADRTNSRLRERHPAIKKLLDNDAAETIEGVYGLEMMDAGSYFRSLGQTVADSIYKPIRKGFDKRVELLREAQDYMKRKLTGIDVKKWSGAGAPKQTFKLVNGDTVDLTPGQVMELYCLTQRRQARDHLTVGGIRVEKRPGVLSKRVSLAPTDIANIVASLSNEQVRMAKELQTYLSTTAAEWGNEASMNMYGIRKFKEKAYWPIKTSDDYVRTNDANSGSGAGLWGVKNKGMTKAVQTKANNPLVIHDAFDTWYQHVDDMATYSSMVAPLSDAMRWYNWRSGTEASTKEALGNLYGEKGKTYFLTLMKDINGLSDRASPTRLNKLLGMLNRNWKVAKVGGNLRVFVQQPTSYLRATAEVNPKYLAEAIAKAPGNIRRAMKEAPKYCPIAQWADWGFFETNIGQSMRDILIGDQTAASKIREMTTAPAGAADHMTRGVLWLACEAEVKGSHPELEGEAFKKAVGDRLGEVIDRTQVVDTVLHRSALMRSKNEAVQMMMNFMAEPTKSYNMMRESAAQFLSADGKTQRNKAGKRFGRVAGTYLATALATSAAAALVDAIRVKDDERDKKLGKRYQTAILENFLDNVNILQSMPIIKDVLSMLEGYDVERSDMTALSDFIDGVKWITTTITKDGKVTFNQIMNHVAGPISSMTGLPLGNVWRDSKGVYDLATGLMDPLNIDRNLRAEKNVVTYDDLVTQVRRESGWPNTGKHLDKLKALYGSNTGTYADMLGGDKAKAVDSWLEALSKNAGKNGEPYTAVLPKMVTNKISYTGADGEQVEVYLGGADYLAYAEQVQKTACDLVYSYINGVGKTASTNQQVKFAVDARNYAVQTARQNFIDGYEVTDWIADVQAQDMDPAEAIAAYAAVKTAKADKDSEGNTISGSKAKNAVAAMVDQGFKEGEARALYESLSGNEDSPYLAMFMQVKDSPQQADELAALFGAGGEAASYAGMLKDKNAGKVDSYLQQLSSREGDSVMPDYVEAMFSYTKDGEKVDVDLDASEYIDYAKSRTETAYDLLDMFLPRSASYGKDIQGEVVNAVEEYAAQTAKSKVSDYEIASWVKKVQQVAGVSGGDVNQAALEAIVAREVINSATGVKGADGKTISGSVKKDAMARLSSAGYNEALAEMYYKMFK